MCGESDAAASSTALARRALVTTLAASLLGSGLGVIGIVRGTATGLEIPLVTSCVLFTSVALVVLRLRSVALQTVATVSTIYFALYLSAGATITITGQPHQHLNALIFLIWFFPLLVFNKLVNEPTIGRLLGRTLLAAPVAMIVLLGPRLAGIFPLQLMFFLGAYALSYLTFGLAFNVVTRYREEYIAERERAESLKVESAVLESISDCFISLDAQMRLVYINDAACAEFGVERQASLTRRAQEAVPQVITDSTFDRLQDAARRTEASAFDAQDESGDRWYEMRCFPRGDGVSIYLRNVTGSRAANAEIARLAFYDTLTELPNRVLLRDRLQAVLDKPSRAEAHSSVLFIDLDDFKTLNDTLGHDIGDLFLTDIAGRLSSCVRANDTVARFGGDEFVVLLEGIGNDPHAAALNAKHVAGKILSAFAAPYRINSVEHISTACIGITLFANEPTTVDELLKEADLAMYRAKAQGPENVCFYALDMQTSAAARAELQSDLRIAMAQHQFALHYQPMVDGDGRVVGAEALLRWPHPRRGLIAPSEFVPLAEEAGLIVELGRWVLETACRQLAVWANVPFMEHLTVAVNVSARQFFAPNFVALVFDVLAATNANPRRLKLELTESSAVENVEDTIGKMTALMKCGITFSMDDFGTGYSSLSHLKRLPLAQLKIDRSFVIDLLTDPRAASIARTLIALGSSLDLSVIAEGVETDGQRRLLANEGCFLYQGFLFSCALAADEFERFTLSGNRESAPSPITALERPARGSGALRGSPF